MTSHPQSPVSKTNEALHAPNFKGTIILDIPIIYTGSATNGVSSVGYTVTMVSEVRDTVTMVSEVRDVVTL